MRVVLSGPPGAGKGTVARALAAQDGSVPISTGNLLRTAVAEGSPLGRSAEGYMLRGDLVPDSIIRGLVERQLRECADRGFILDGFPRTIPQAFPSTCCWNAWPTGAPAPTCSARRSTISSPIRRRPGTPAGAAASPWSRVLMRRNMRSTPS